MPICKYIDIETKKGIFSYFSEVNIAYFGFKCGKHAHIHTRITNGQMIVSQQLSKHVCYFYDLFSNPFSCISFVGLNQWIVLRSLWIRVKLHSEEGAVNCLILVHAALLPYNAFAPLINFFSSTIH